MTVNELLAKLRANPESIEFSEVIGVIDQCYDYTPTRFSNGSLVNAAGTNEGSCKIFAFAQLNNLSEMETLALFGHYYRDDVMGNPSGQDHANIRNFLIEGWLAIQFDGAVLAPRRIH